MGLVLRSIFADIFNFFFRPKRYGASATLGMRDIYHALFRFIFSSEVQRRSRLDSENSAEALFALPNKEGYLKITPYLDKNLRDEVLAECRKICSETLTPEYLKKFENAPFASIPINRDLNRKNPFLRFALQPGLIKALTRYFGIVPVIEGIYIWYSPNKVNLSNSSQFYHLDGQDVKTVQLFLFIEDVGPENGPLIFVEAERSVEIAKEIGYRKTKRLKRIDDALIKSMTTPNQVVQATGPAGECYAVDTDRCLHYGSRMATKPRYTVIFQYYTPFAFALPWRWWTKLPFADAGRAAEFNPLEKAVMGAKD